MDFVPLAAFALLIVGVVNFLKFLKARDWNGALTTLIAWIGGIVAVIVAGHSDFGSGIPVGDITLADLNFWSQVFVGMTVASVGSYVVDVKKALDDNDSAKTPPLIES